MPEPWPASAAWGTGGLSVAGAAAASLAGRFGTPLLVYDEDEIRSRMRTVRSAFPRVAYAVKAMTCAAIVRAALEEGLDLLCASGGEVTTCLRAGAPPTRIAMHGNAKTDEELGLAVRAGIRHVIVDDGSELDRLAVIARGAGVTQPILLRVIPEVKVETHEAIATGHAESKFGVPLASAPVVVRRASTTAGVRLDGVHAHAGSQLLDADAYIGVLDALIDVTREAGLPFRVLDVGGGFGVPYGDESPLDVGALSAALHDRLGARGVSAELQVEPGRTLVANAGLTLYRVMSVKRAGGRTLVAVDGGMSDNLRPALYEAHHEVRAVAPRTQSSQIVTIVGRHCESGDVVAPTAELPEDIGRDDLVAVAATGAYTYPLASAYNRFGRPAVVGVRDGDPTTWIRREERDDMDRLDVILGTPWDAAVPAVEGGARP
jgi:diaminopimelate decarboxylase